MKNNIAIELHVPDFEPARGFYAMFGFTECLYKARTGGGHDLGYLVLRREDDCGATLLNFYGGKESISLQSHFRQFDPHTPRGYAVEISIPVTDVAALWNEVKDAIAPSQVAQPLQTKRWGKQDFRVIDPFGFYVRFTEPIDWGQ
jgi:uncharacterized glyoxalase superfamily protein PhnB